jgi:hypothetical protein
MDSPEGWPVLPEHHTVLILHLPPLPPSFHPVLVTGLGTVMPAPKSVDVSHYLALPEFWSYQVSLHIHPEDADDPLAGFLDVSMDASNDWYKSHIESLHRQGTWPYIRLALSDSRYIDYEMAAGVEYQDRIWIGDTRTATRVLLGYHSGHFSLPGLRLEEVEWFHKQCPNPCATLLLLLACYLETPEEPFEFVRELVGAIPGVRRTQVDERTRVLLGHLWVKDLRWSEHPTHGWINNWPYSQRNPESRLSLLGPSDFQEIRAYFGTTRS